MVRYFIPYVCNKRKLTHHDIMPCYLIPKTDAAMTLLRRGCCTRLVIEVWNDLADTFAASMSSFTDVANDLSDHSPVYFSQMHPVCY